MTNHYIELPLTTDPTLAGRVNTLENVYVRVTRFISIASGASGSITLPSGAEVILDDFGGGLDAMLSGITAGRPDYSQVRTSGGSVVACTLDGGGNWTVTATPGAYPIALIYRTRSKLKDFDSTASDIIGSEVIEKVADGVPVGGSTGQILKKHSITDYDTEWGNDSGFTSDGSTKTTTNLKVGIGNASPLAALDVAKDLAVGEDIWVGPKTDSVVPGTPWKVPITISNSGMTSSFTNAVVSVKSASDTNVGRYAKSDGSDVRFTLSNGTALSYEKKYFSIISSNTAAYEFLVKIPTLTNSSPTTIYLHYGNSSATDASDGVNTFTAWDRAYPLRAASTADTHDETRVSSDTTKDLTRVGDILWNSSGYYDKSASHDGSITVDLTGTDITNGCAIELVVAGNGGDTSNRILWSIGSANQEMAMIYTDSYQIYFYTCHNGGFNSWSLGNTYDFLGTSASSYIRILKDGSVNPKWLVYLNGVRKDPTGIICYITNPTKMQVFACSWTGTLGYGSSGGVRAKLQGLYFKAGTPVSNQAVCDTFNPARTTVSTTSKYGAFTGFKASITSGQWDIYSLGVKLGYFAQGALYHDYLAGTTIAGSTLISNNYKSNSGQKALAYIENGTGIVKTGVSFETTDGQNTWCAAALRPNNITPGAVPWMHSGTSRLEGDLSRLWLDPVNSHFGAFTQNLSNMLQIGGGDTVGAASGSLSFNYYPVPMAPGGSENISFNYFVAAVCPTAFNVSTINYSAGSYLDTGLQHIYRVLTINGGNQRSTTYLEYSVTDSGTSSVNYQVELDWSSQPGQGVSHYVVEHSRDNGATWEWLNNSNTTGLVDNGMLSWTPGNDTTAYVVPYNATALHIYRSYNKNGIAYSSYYEFSSSSGDLGLPTGAAYNSGAAETSGSTYEQIGQSWTYYIYSICERMSGYQQYQATPVVCPITLTNNPGNYTDVYVDWQPDGGSYITGYLIIKDDGTNQYSQIVSGAGIYNFLDQNGGWASYTGTAAPASISLVYTIDVTPPTNNCEIYKEDSLSGYLFDHYRSGDISTFTDVPANWYAGTVVQVGWFNSGLTHSRELFGSLIKSGHTIRNDTSVTLSDTDNGMNDSYYTISYNFSFPWNGNRAILQDIVAGKYLSLDATYYTDDGSFSGWTTGDPFLLPTEIIPFLKVTDTGDVYASTTKLNV